MLEPRLRDQLTAVNDWLKFAETKHVFLVAFNGAALAALATLVKDVVLNTRTSPPWVPSRWLTAYATVAGVLLALALATSLAAVLPQLWAPPGGTRPHAASDVNLAYYGQLATLTVDGYLEALAGAVGVDDPSRTTYPATRWERDLAHQVVVNAAIAVRKYRAFNLACGLTLCGLLTPFAGLVWVAVEWIRRQAPQS